MYSLSIAAERLPYVWGMLLVGVASFLHSCGQGSAFQEPEKAWVSVSSTAEGAFIGQESAAEQQELTAWVAHALDFTQQAGGLVHAQLMCDAQRREVQKHLRAILVLVAQPLGLTPLKQALAVSIAHMVDLIATAQTKHSNTVLLQDIQRLVPVGLMHLAVEKDGRYPKKLYEVFDELVPGRKLRGMACMAAEPQEEKRALVQ